MKNKKCKKCGGLLSLYGRLELYDEYCDGCGRTLCIPVKGEKDLEIMKESIIGERLYEQFGAEGLTKDK